MNDNDKIQDSAYGMEWWYAKDGIRKSTKVDTNLLYSVSCLDGVFFMDDYFIVVLHKLH